MTVLDRRAVLAAAVLACFTPPLAAQEIRAGDLVIAEPWSRATPGGARVAAGYLRIVNRGSAPDRLVSATAEIAPRVELHEMATVDGVMRMREIAGGIVVPPGGAVALEPGGLHVMFMDLGRQLREGERFRGTLVFERAGAVPVEFAVRAIGAGAGHGHGHGTGHGHGAPAGHAAPAGHGAGGHSR